MPALSKVRITNALARTLGVGDHADAEVRGLSLRVTPAGSRSWTLRYRPQGERGQKRITIGPFPALTVEEARQLARARIGEVIKGEDPAAKKKQARLEPTFQEIADRYLAAGLFAAKTRENHRHLLSKILPIFGRRKLADINREEIERFHKSLEAIPATANACVSLISTIYHKAEEWEITTRNPAAGIKLHRTRKHERFLTADERAILWSTLDACEANTRTSKATIAAIRFLSLCGWRKSEALSLQWTMVNWEGESVDLPETKTGRSHRILSPEAMDFLRAIYQKRDPANPWVFPTSTGVPPTIKQFDRSWGRIRKRLPPEVMHFRMHDLRHSFASDAVNEGVPIAVIGALLGHRNPKSTQRYAHLANDTVRAAARQVGARIAARNQPDTSGDADVIPMPRKRRA